MRIRKLAALLLSILLVATGSCFALTIKLGTLAPRGSPWELSLKRLAAEWKEISKGKVVLKIYPGGIAGDEQDMIRKMRIGQLDAAGVTVGGLISIYPEIMVLTLPLLIRNEDEYIHVFQEMKPSYEEELNRRGFQVILWTNAGWMYFFSRHPVVSPEDLSRQKLWVRTGDASEVQAWQKAGFHPVPLSANDITISLQNGMIDALAVSPLTAASYQWFGLASHMCDLKLAPFFGAVMITTKTWNRIPDSLKADLLAAASRIGSQMETEVWQADTQAITIMKRYGLQVNPVPEDVEKEWRIVIESAYQHLLGASFEKKSFDRVMIRLQEHRNNNSK